MTSVLTNASASAALRTLCAIGRDLDATSQRVATGLRIGAASDGAAYWSIATTLRSDNGSLGALRDAIGLDRAVVDVTARGLDKVVEQLDVMSRTLVTAMDMRVDPAKLQGAIAGAQRIIRTVGDGATMNGLNWLSVDSGGTGFEATKDPVVGVSRRDGTASLGTTALDTSGFILFDGRPREGNGSEFSIVPATVSLPSTLRGIAATASTPPPDGYQLTTWDGLSTRGTEDLYLTWNFGLMDTLYDVHDGNRGKQPFSIASIDLTSSEADAPMIRAFAKVVDATRRNLLDGASTLGATSTLLGGQQEFTRRLMDINASSIGTLVDADVEEESVRLKALQTQQQLGLQALGLANASSQIVLSLFRQ